MEAGTLGCPLCGAPVSSNSPKCLHCGARLATVACPSCFAMIFEGSKFCAHCGAQTSRVAAGKTKLPCPKCRIPLAQVQLGQTPVHECAKCHGLWVAAAVFDQICTDRERQSAVLGTASELFRPGEKQLDLKVKYIRCPACQELMHRVNFAKCSGIILDICKGHGTWFDQDELQHIVQFIRTGGLELARENEKAELEAARRRLEAARSAPERNSSYQSGGRPWSFQEEDLISIAGSLLWKSRK
jgi:Zn-finger nucleic acid-binding protein